MQFLSSSQMLLYKDAMNCISKQQYFIAHQSWSMTYLVQKYFLKKYYFYTFWVAVRLWKWKIKQTFFPFFFFFIWFIKDRDYVV